MTFLENIFERLHQTGSAPILREIRHGKINSVSGNELLSLVQEARNFLVARGMKKGDRCALLASNSIRWVALTHQYDMLGRLCAYLAPYETQIANGGW